MTNYRVLSPEEIPSDADVAPGSLVLGLVEDDEVVALIAACPVWRIHPLWTKPERRPQVKLRGLATEFKKLLSHIGGEAFTFSLDKVHPKMASLMRRVLGGIEQKDRTFFFVPLDKEAHNG